MSGAVIPPVAPAPPSAGGAHLNAELGAWKKPLLAKPGNVTLSQRGKIWLGIFVWCAATWGALFWVAASLYRGGGL